MQEKNEQKDEHVGKKARISSFSAINFLNISASVKTVESVVVEPPGEPWLESDTWYLLQCQSCFWNARTGVAQQEEPSNLRNDGCKRRSAPVSGPWAVPFLKTQPPPVLQLQRLTRPLELKDSAMHEPVVESWGSQTGPIFTAPHSVCLARDDHPPHLPEDFTHFLARVWATETQGTNICWSLGAHRFSEAQEAPLPYARDPNFLTFEERHTNDWVRSFCKLHRQADKFIECFHVDVHGKRDRPGEGDCDIGVGACRHAYGDAAAEAVVKILEKALEAALRGKYKVDPRPRLQGRWRSVPRLSLTQSSTMLGHVAVQIELGYQLRRALCRDMHLCLRVANAFSDSAADCVEVCWSAKRQAQN
eukprot:TRINITY_DN67402_c0_g1_i1.p1 TRINITY_DN67402_c0_g1~~TRINITY_DN67402_c0_g1_i1.p1  ORF type:complete len:362 (+),score=60.63 TRINITY_DN67402_c0_g1_i1:79-1164(+)